MTRKDLAIKWHSILKTVAFQATKDMHLFPALKGGQVQCRIIRMWNKQYDAIDAMSLRFTMLSLIHI